MNEDIIYLVVIIFLIIAISLAAIFFTFYCVLMYGAFEEGDDVFDFCKMGVVKLLDGKWVINGGDLFDENAVIKAKFGFTFILLFGGWEIWIDSKGSKAGLSKSIVCKETCFLRRKIRRF